ncbi:MAG: hypothetical protein V3R93_05625 [Candidatus Hydrothermarchaeaceae archaeon]
MPFKFQAPVKMPRFTREEFIEQKRKYVAKYGYTIHIPGFSDIFTWNVTPEPTPAELILYKAKKVKELGEKRYEDIKALMAQKRSNYLRMLSSPTPQVVQNAGSVLTTLDDINDTLGTLAMVARIVARRLPAAAAKFLLGPAGWALMGADIANLALKLTSLPFKAHRLQHELNEVVKGNPLSKKAKLQRMNKLKRLRISKGELIEALQTTDNMFGVGISLGGIVGMITDIPSGLYHHIRGEKVTITGLPAPLLWFDRVWSRMLKGAVGLFYGPVDLPEEEINKGIVAANFASQAAHTYLDGTSPLDAISDPDGVELLAPRPQHPSTIQVITEETPQFEQYIGWIHNSSLWTNAADMFDQTVESVQDNMSQWVDRNKNSMEGQATAQMMVDVGPNILATMEGDDQLEMSYDPIAESLLKLMNVNLRFPLDLTQDQILCWSDGLSDDFSKSGSIDNKKSRSIAKDKCGFEFHTEVPEREGLTDEELEEQRLHNIDRLRTWHFYRIIFIYEGWKRLQTREIPPAWNDFLEATQNHVDWLLYYGYAPGDPAGWKSRLNLLQLEYYHALFSVFP